jgi:GNAT superfamily N-acetyltransferase
MTFFFTTVTLAGAIMTDDFAVRRATPDDIPTILFHRRSMFTEMGVGTPEALNTMEIGFEPWLRRKMAQEHYLGWMATTENGEIAAGAGLWLMDWPPTVIEPGSLRAYMLNVYTNPEYRKRGLAHRLTQTIINWCKENGYHLLVLHASDAGRPIYESIGFKLSNEMRLLL